MTVISVVPFSATNISDVLTLQPIDPEIDHDGNIFLEWNEVYDANQYFVKMRKDAGDWEVTKMTQSFSFTKTGLTDGAYEFEIEAWHMTFIKIELVTSSNIEQVTVFIFTVPDTPVLEIIESPNIDGEISLEWDVVPDALYYKVYKSIDGVNYDVIYPIIEENYYNDLVYIDGTYSYKIKAGNDVGTSDFSNIVSVTVQLPRIPDVPLMNELTYEIIEDTTRVCIDWEEVDCDSYNLYKSIDGGDYELIEEGLTSTSYSEVLTEDGLYIYGVSAVNIFGESGLSDPTSIIITEDGGVEPPAEADDYTMLYILLGILVALVIPIVILVKRKKR